MSAPLIDKGLQMLLALNTFIWTSRFDRSHLPLLERIKALGADAVEFQRSGFDDFPVDLLGTELARLGLSCTLCTSPPRPDTCIINHDPEARSRGLAYLRDSILVARDLGAKMVVGPLYAPPYWFTGFRASQDEWRWAIEGFAALGQALASTDLVGHRADQPVRNVLPKHRRARESTLSRHRKCEDRPAAGRGAYGDRREKPGRGGHGRRRWAQASASHRERQRCSGDRQLD
jgi:sugar phosphate isomerase/epimerase